MQFRLGGDASSSQIPEPLLAHDVKLNSDNGDASCIRDTAVERRGSLSLVSGGPAYGPLEVASAEARQLHRTNQEQGFAAWKEQQMFLNPDVYMKNEVPAVSEVEIASSLKQTELELPIPKFDAKPVAEYGDMEKMELGLCEGQGLRRLLQQPSRTPELESIGSFSAWFDCITKSNGTEMETTSLSEERCTKTSFEMDTKPVKKAPKLTKAEKNSKTAAAVHSHEGTEDDMCTDDDTGPVLIDEKRKRRMLSNRASAQRSRQRRQDRLDQLEILTAQLRVENASLLRKSNLALQLARKFEGENKKLLEKENYLSKELLEARKPAAPKLHGDCHSSPNTCTDVSEIVGEEDLSPEVELNLEKVPDDRKKPMKSTVSNSYMTVDDQMDMKNTSKDVDMTADRNNERENKFKTVQVSDIGRAARKEKWDSIRSPVSCKAGWKNTEFSSLGTSLPQANLLSPVNGTVPMTILDLDSRYLLKEICDLFDSDSANDPYVNNDILNVMDQNWLESFAECLNA